MKTRWSQFAATAFALFLAAGGVVVGSASRAAQSPGNRPAVPASSAQPIGGGQGGANQGAPADLAGTAARKTSGNTSANPSGNTSSNPSGSPSGNPAIDQLLDHIVERERLMLQALNQRMPLIETYIQETPGGESPTKDHYFLGRFRLADTVGYEALVARTDPAAAKPPWRFSLRAGHPSKRGPARGAPSAFLPRGFAQMAVPDLHDFNRQVYHFEYVRREFLGEVRCLVFDVEPLNRLQPGKFIGRIWVEDRDAAVVRFNGTYIPAAPPKGALPELYFHFDSWRVHASAGLWVPAQIYVEEESSDIHTGAATRFKAQSRIWDYAAMPGAKLAELTGILVENVSAVKDEDASQDVSPLESQRSWEHQAEENLIARLEKGGLIAPAGPVDAVLNTVVNNLIVSARLGVQVHCRVLLTTPMETFAIGRTIVISRGLIDVLPDEASLALVLADQLAHIALGHRTPTQYAFTSQTMVSDLEVLQRLRFQRTPGEMLEAGKKTIEIMRASPYANTAHAGLFLKALAARTDALPDLLHPNLGDQISDAQSLARLQQFADGAPALDENELEQIAALPLGSRVKLNPWDNRLDLIKTRPLSLLSPREKMPFEVTPFVLYLTRTDAAAASKE
jgi:hypothetical protein